ncbi:hypothetical protein [Dysgonomonas sp. 25]|uniref:hypothetical protein n=1 Tax=Dysgonomonas sp. 25 TaxID=2302933 RepID=UPI0013D5C47F|nr:hypothetical protein [Dysgonomonas sp. 25]NDV68559.1 hypothetical protein [Dysgonomonas sp. 25]
MTNNDFKKYLKRAIQLCEDYDTTTLDSETVQMIWFTPQQLRQFAEYIEKETIKLNTDNKKQ